MDNKKDDEDEDDEQEQEAKSANLLRRIKHQKSLTMVPSYGSFVRNLKLHSPRSPRSKRLQRSGDGDGSWEIQ